MGVIRGSLLIIVGILLFGSFLVGNVFWTFSLSLTYENVQEEFTSIVNQLLDQEGNLTSSVEERMDSMVAYCQNASEYVFSEGIDVFVIPCDVVELGPQEVVNYGVSDFVETAYYAEYSCSFWSCFSKTKQPFFLISKKAKDYWHSKFYFMLLCSGILIVLMFLLVERKPNLLIMAGALLLGASVLFRQVDGLLSLIDESMLQFLGVFFSETNIVFFTGALISIVLIGLGILLRIFRWDHTKKKFSKEDVKKIVKEEVSNFKKESSSRRGQAKEEESSSRRGQAKEVSKSKKAVEKKIASKTKK